MRKRPIGTLAAVVAVVLAGCAQPTPKADLLFVRTSKGIALVKALPKAVAVRLSDAVPSTDWSALIRADTRGTKTRVTALDASSGSRLWSRDVSGHLEVKVASGDGRLVALGRPRANAGYPSGRSSTPLVLVGEGARETRTIRLKGNFEPEAFSTDGGSLFVIQYLPPRDPNRYRVRRLDLRTGKVVGVYTADAELQEAMQGTARVQAASQDGRRLYTLYSLEGVNGVRRAFIHVLSLDELWAHCVDLPATFGNAAEKGIALSVAPDGKRLYVADASTGAVAEVDTEALTVARSTHVSFSSSGEPLYAERGTNGMLYLGSGSGLVAVNASTLTPGRSWDMRERITGIQAASDGTRLYVGLRDQIAILDTVTGDKLGVLKPSHIGTIDQLGRSTPSLDEGRTEILCAC